MMPEDPSRQKARRRNEQTLNGNGNGNGGGAGNGNGGATDTDAASAETDQHAATEADRWATKRVFTTGEAAQVCKVSQQTIIRCFDSGRLEGFRVPGSRFRRIPRDELIRFMKTNDIPTEVLDGGKKRVLVVDDDPNILEVFRDALGRDGRFEVRTAPTGYDAGMLTEAFRPHLIVLDYMLPDVNGNVVCRRIRENDALSDIKILFVSGVVNQAEVDDLLQSGGDGFMKKPFGVDALLAKIEELLSVA
jgi:excisionase family DNA binding protein